MSDTDERVTEKIPATMALVERRHAEAKHSFKAIRERIDKAEREAMLTNAKVEQHEERLNVGGAKIAQIDAQLRPSLQKVVGWALAIVLPGAGLIWGASEFVTRSEIRTEIEERSPYLRDRDRIIRSADRLDRVESEFGVKLQRIQLDQVEIRSDLKQLLRYHEQSDGRRGRSK